MTRLSKSTLETPIIALLMTKDAFNAGKFDLSVSLVKDLCFVLSIFALKLYYTSEQQLILIQLACLNKMDNRIRFLHTDKFPDFLLQFQFDQGVLSNFKLLSELYKSLTTQSEKMDFNNDNFGIEDIKLDSNSAQKQKNDQTQAARNTKVSDGNFESSDNGQLGLSVNKSSFDLNRAAHPVACIFTFAFKAVAVIMYFIGQAFFSGTLTFIIVVLLDAFDFWTVKNITGRLLLGFRWSAEYNDKGESVMKYQTHDKQYSANPVDSAFFWASQVGFSLLWIVLIVIKVITLSFIFDFIWFLSVCLSQFTTFSNLYAFYQCKKQYADKFKDLKKDIGMAAFNRFL